MRWGPLSKGRGGGDWQHRGRGTVERKKLGGPKYSQKLPAWGGEAGKGRAGTKTRWSCWEGLQKAFLSGGFKGDLDALANLRMRGIDR